MNPIFQQVNRDPYSMLRQLASQNPAYEPIMRMLQNGSSPEYVFRQLCSQRGINPDQFIQGLYKQERR